MNISNLQYSVRDLIRQDTRLVSPSEARAEEAVHCWIVNLVREEGLEERVAPLSRRCMTRFLDSLDQDSLPAWRASQLLAAASLLVTTKIVSTNPPGGKKLIKYAGGAFSMEELMVSSVISIIITVSMRGPVTTVVTREAVWLLFQSASSPD